jgi:hypothetical protein
MCRISLSMSSGSLRAERLYSSADGLFHQVEFGVGPDQWWAYLDFSADKGSGKDPVLAQRAAELRGEGR